MDNGKRAKAKPGAKNEGSNQNTQATHQGSHEREQTSTPKNRKVTKVSAREDSQPKIKNKERQRVGTPTKSGSNAAKPASTRNN
ncbi:hypothetical protein [Bacteroides graminisolvens]|uniref:hypothetical protein n=1 Tax=Bacteroides graminisolvens TaxID=477666 RepID=UPI0012B591CD|nr:hypothetical protein [Bacteroides graminisolvens]